MITKLYRWLYHTFVPVRSGFMYETQKGARLYVQCTPTSILVFWKSDYSGPHYTIPKPKWYKFIGDSNITFIGVQKQGDS